MKQKLKELAKFCCEPKSEAEFLAVKLAAEKGGVDWYRGNQYISRCPFIRLDDEYELVACPVTEQKEQLPVHEYCQLLMKDESEFDRRVELGTYGSPYCAIDNFRTYKCKDGYHWEVNGNEVSLVRD